MAEIRQLLWFCANLNGSDRTLLSEVSFLTFPWRNGQNVGGRQHSVGCRHFGRFSSWRASTTSRAHISWADLWRDPTWGPEGGGATPSEGENENKNANFSRAEKESRVESPPSPNSKSLDADLIVCACISAVFLFSDLYYKTQTCFCMRWHFM